MARVPYNPVPTAQPQDPGEAISVNTPGAAFGENIGAAISHLGTTTGEVGNELFTRAIALQEVTNQADARNAQSTYAIQSAQMQAQYDAKEGKDSYTGLQDHLKQLSDLRTQIRVGLKSPQAQQYYDSDSLPFMQRMVFTSAGRAADQQKSYVLNTYGAQGAILKRQVEDDPSDDVAFQRNGQKLRDATAQAAMIHFGVHDPNDPIIKNAVQKEMQSYVAGRIKGIARDDPARATAMLEANKADLGDEYEPLQSVIETRGNVVASSNISDKILGMHRQADGTYDATYQQMQQEVRDEAKKQFPNNSTLPETSTSTFDTKLIRARFASEQDKREALHQIDTAILNGHVTDTQELFAMPGMDKVVERYGKFDPRGAAELQAHIFNINQSANRITKEQSLSYIYHGLANGGPDGSLDEFLKLDPFDPKWHLNATDAKAVIAKQFEVSKSMAINPKVNTAMSAITGSMGGQLDDLHVTGKLKEDDKYYAFKGALGAALEEWQMDNKRPASNDEILQKIAPAIVRQMASPPSTVFGVQIPFTGSQEPAFELMREHIQGVIAEAKKRNIEPPSEDEIRRAYLQQTFQQLFGGSAGSKSSGPKSQGGPDGGSDLPL